MNENLVDPNSKNIKKTIDLSVDVFFEINFIIVKTYLICGGWKKF